MSKKKNDSGTATSQTQEEKLETLLAHKAEAAIAHAKKLSGAIILVLYQFANNGLLSGRQGGNVMMRNGRARKMTVPSLVQNAYTQAQRASLGAFSSLWNSLTQAQITAWNNRSGFFRSDRFGISHEIKGKTLFVALNQNLFNTGGIPISDPPSATDVPGITSLSLAIADAANTFVLTFDPTPTVTNVIHLVFATAPLSLGTSKPSLSAYRLISIIPGATATGTTMQTAYTDKFGAPVAGTKIFMKLIPIQRVTGQAGPAIVASTVVAA